MKDEKDVGEDSSRVYARDWQVRQSLSFYPKIQALAAHTILAHFPRGWKRTGRLGHIVRPGDHLPTGIGRCLSLVSG